MAMDNHRLGLPGAEGPVEKFLHLPDRVFQAQAANVARRLGSLGRCRSDLFRFLDRPLGATARDEFEFWPAAAGGAELRDRDPHFERARGDQRLAVGELEDLHVCVQSPVVHPAVLPEVRDTQGSLGR